MAFIKHGDGKIISVVETDELTEDQKRKVKKGSQDSDKSDKVEDNKSN